MGNKAGAPTMEIGKTLTDENVAELSALTGFPPNHIREYHEGFLKDCPTGILNKKKFVDFYKLFYPNGKAEKFCECVFRTFSNDGSGSIDFSDFLIAISITAQHEPRKKLEWVFTMYDIDRNGFVDKKEMKTVLNAIFDLVGDERHSADSPELIVDEIVGKMDMNGDGKLSKEEFINGCLDHDHLRRLLAP